MFRLITLENVRNSLETFEKEYSNATELENVIRLPTVPE